MEIKRVKEESYESISKYLDELLTLVPRLTDLCLIRDKDKQYMVSFDKNKVGIVENDDGQFNRYVLERVDEIKEIYKNKDFEYQIMTKDGVKDVIRKSKLTNNSERLSYQPREDDYPRDIIEYAQYLNNIGASFLGKYDVTLRQNIKSAILYTKYHYPNTLIIELIDNFIIPYIKKYLYYLNSSEDYYYRNKILIFNKLLIAKKKKSDELINDLVSLGFNKEIQEELASILVGNNEQYNSLKLVRDNYQNFIKGH